LELAWGGIPNSGSIGVVYVQNIGCMGNAPVAVQYELTKKNPACSRVFG
jgi:hypothetical protein